MRIKLYSILLFCASALSATAQQNYVLNLDGVNDYVDVGASAGNGLRTIECWFRLDAPYNSSASGVISLIARNDATQYHEFALYLSNFTGQQGCLVFARRINGTGYDVLSNSNSWNANQWYHAAGVIHPVNGMQLYIDGVLQSNTDASTSATGVAPELTALGCWGDAGIRFLDGRLDEVRFWNRALSASEIQSKMCYWLDPVNESGLVGYWRFNEGAGSTANDMSGNNYTGVILNNAGWVQENSCSTFSIAEEIVADLFTVFPNPSSGIFTISCSASITRICIFSILGEEVFSVEEKEKEFKCDISDLPKGIYLVKAYTGNKAGVQRIIVQ